MFWVHEKEIHPGPAFGCENQKRKGKTKMKSKKAVRSALGMSVLSIALCAAMLIGTTFAWFTDTATTSVNKIQSGTLDIALEMKDNAGKWVSAEGKTLNFLRKNGEGLAEDANILWEPGCTYQLPQLRVVNKGNLAVKFKVAVTGLEGNTELAPVIEWTINGLKLGDDLHLAPKANGTEVFPATEFTISAHMQETAGNEYQNKSIENIAITVVATQDTVEYDSKDNQYDADAIYPVVAAATVNTGSATVLKDKEVDHNVKLTAPAGSVAAGTTSLKLTVDTVSTPAGITVSDTQNSQTFEVKLVDQKGEKVEATGALFEVEMNVGTGRTGLKLYHDGVLMTKDNGMLADEADHYVYDSATGYVTMKVSHFSPFTAVFNKEKWENHAAESYAKPVDETNKVVTIASAEELALFAKQVTDENKNYSNYTVNITEDIDLGDYLWKPINGYGKMSGITINGNGNTISNMMVRGCTNDSGYGAGFIGDTRGAITIQDITFDGADVFFRDYVNPQYYGNVGAIVMGYTYGTTLFDNVKVINSEIWGYGKIGILLGMGADPGVKVTFKDCVSKNNTINAAYDMGGLAGMIQRGNGVDNGSVENCTVEDITVNYYGTTVDVKGKATLKSNDQPSGTDVTRDIDGKYFDEAGYYWCAFGDYYVSYGDSSYDAPVDGYNKCLANSEYSVNK